MSWVAISCLIVGSLIIAAMVIEMSTVCQYLETYSNATRACNVKHQTGATYATVRAVAAVSPCSHTTFRSVHACIPGLR
jgi:hypothetical protein